MKRVVSSIIITVILITVISVTDACRQNSNLTVNYLRCQYLTNPCGIDIMNPVLSWQIISSDEGTVQAAYQVKVSSSEKGEGDIWDSGKVNDRDAAHILYKGKALEPEKKYYWNVRIWDDAGRESPWSKTATWCTGLFQPEDWKAEWITGDFTTARSMPLFRREFNIGKKVSRALVSVSGLGYYELYLNGKKVGDQVLDPAQTNYDQYALYSAFEVTGLLKRGENAAGIMLGDGWYNQDKAFGANFSYGKPKLIFQMKMVYGDGSSETLVSDTSWQWAEGPVVAANVYAGETYDAGKEIKGWCEPGKPSGIWHPTVKAANPPSQLRAQLMPPIRKVKVIQPVGIRKTGDSTWVVDMGQNFAGWVKIRVKEPAGAVVRIRMSEEVYPDGSPDYTSTGVSATRYIQTDTYICRGSGTETWEPRFTYHGFRYAEVSGLSHDPDKGFLEGVVVHTDVPTTGSFRCSSDIINQLHEMALWTQVSNLHGIPTDCPHREKCGWLGDAHAVLPMTNYNYDMQAFWIKYLNDIRSSASREGMTLHHKAKNRVFYQAYKNKGIPFMIAPGKRECGAASVDWGTALVQIPWSLYLFYGNMDVLRDFYPDMSTWVAYEETLAKDNLILEGLGDWCPPGGNALMDCPFELSSTAFYYHDLTLMQKIAGLLGHQEDMKQNGEVSLKVKEAFIARYYDQGSKSFGSQTANSLALDFGLAPAGDEKAVSDAIARSVRENSGFHHTGIFGLPRIFDALALYENQEAAAGILSVTGPKSFENMWKYYGATTLWETLPVEAPVEGEKPRSYGSHNHPMQGGFDGWFYKGIAGIAPDAEHPGFATIRFEPLLVDYLDWAEASFESVRGTIKSAWKKESGKFTWNITIPVNSDGWAVLPWNESDSVILDHADAARWLNDHAGKKIIHLKAGNHMIEIFTGNKKP